MLIILNNHIDCWLKPIFDNCLLEFFIWKILMQMEEPNIKMTKQKQLPHRYIYWFCHANYLAWKTTDN